ncbi:hypothetical protein BDW59DRAFT_159735 [Aspergillus cavernicola]|uniref:Myb-like domain-containing protein n=1 Tax=Aspergillus cavernicola TaxID=176166 RepID=A0ABR4IL97_9EURO
MVGPSRQFPDPAKKHNLLYSVDSRALPVVASPDAFLRSPLLEVLCFSTESGSGIMPILISDGRRYRVPFMSLLRGSVRGERPSYSAQNESTDGYQGVPRASTRRVHAKGALRTAPWSNDDDRLLRELKASKISWKRISAVIDNRPIGEIKKRWIDIQDGKHRLRELTEVDDDWNFDEENDGENHNVSFDTSSDEEEDTDEDEDSVYEPPKVKKVYYIDDEFTLDEVLLLHQVAADWKKDRWQTISSRFNDMTGRSIIPTQARSVIKD